MGAGPANHTGQDAFFPDQAKGFAETVVSNQFDISGNIQAGRAGLHTGSRNSHAIGFLSGLCLSFHQGDEIRLVIFDGVEHRRQGRGAPEIALGVQSDPFGNVFNFLEILLVSLACRRRLQDVQNPVDPDHTDGTLPAGQLPGLFQIGQGQGQDIRPGVYHDHAVPPHQGRDFLTPKLDRNFQLCGFRGLCRGTFPVIHNLAVPTAKCDCIHA